MRVISLFTNILIISFVIIDQVELSVFGTLTQAIGDVGSLGKSVASGAVEQAKSVGGSVASKAVGGVEKVGSISDSVVTGVSKGVGKVGGHVISGVATGVGKVGNSLVTGMAEGAGLEKGSLMSGMSEKLGLPASVTNAAKLVEWFEWINQKASNAVQWGKKGVKKVKEWVNPKNWKKEKP